MGNDIQDIIFSDFSSPELPTEEVLSKKPTKKDLNDVQRILDDFKIDVVVTLLEFNTRFELQRFLRDQIAKKLKKY